MKRLAIYCADIGSIKQGNFAWARVEVPGGEVEEHRGGEEIVDLVEGVAEDLEGGLPVALGFESPQFVPVCEEADQVGSGRLGEGARAWSASAGATVLGLGLVQVSWVLRELRGRRPRAVAYLDWRDFETAVDAGERLFLWEAFVTGRAKAATHVEDAEVAVICFREALPDPTGANAVEAERPLSLIGAAMLWAGWSDDRDLLHTPCLVIRAAEPPADV